MTPAKRKRCQGKRYRLGYVEPISQCVRKEGHAGDCSLRELPKPRPQPRSGSEVERLAALTPSARSTLAWMLGRDARMWFTFAKRGPELRQFRTDVARGYRIFARLLCAASRKP